MIFKSWQSEEVSLKNFCLSSSFTFTNDYFSSGLSNEFTSRLRAKSQPLLSSHCFVVRNCCQGLSRPSLTQIGTIWSVRRVQIQPESRNIIGLQHKELKATHYKVPAFGEGVGNQNHVISEGLPLFSVPAIARNLNCEILGRLNVSRAAEKCKTHGPCQSDLKPGDCLAV